MTNQAFELQAVTDEDLQAAAGGKAGTAELGWPPAVEVGRVRRPGLARVLI